MSFSSSVLTSDLEVQEILKSVIIILRELRRVFVDSDSAGSHQTTDCWTIKMDLGLFELHSLMAHLERHRRSRMSTGKLKI